LIAVAFYLPDKRRPKWKLALSVICAASAPSLMILFLLLSRGEFFHFVTHYILYIMKYVGNPLSMERFFYLVHINNIYWTVFWLHAAVSGISLILCCFFRNSITAAPCADCRGIHVDHVRCLSVLDEIRAIARDHSFTALFSYDHFNYSYSQN